MYRPEDGLRGPIEVRVGPTKSRVIPECKAGFGRYCTDFTSSSRGTNMTFVFEASDRYEMAALLRSVSHIKYSTVNYDGENYSSSSFLHEILSPYICWLKDTCASTPPRATDTWDFPTNCDRLWEIYLLPLLRDGADALAMAWDAGMEDLARYECGCLDERQELENFRWILDHLAEGVQLIPDPEFLSLAWSIGEWDGVDEGRPLMPALRRKLLDTFTMGNSSVQQSHSRRQDEHSLGGVVYISLSPLECDVCRRLFLEPNGTRRLFYHDELLPSTHNLGLEPKDWLPRKPPLHLDCQCLLHRFTGWELWVQDGFIPKVTRLPSYSLEALEEGPLGIWMSRSLSTSSPP